MLSSRYYDFEDIPEEVLSKIDFLLVGVCKEERTRKIPTSLKDKLAGRIITIEYDIETEKYILTRSDDMIIDRTEGISEIGTDLIPNFIDELKKLEIDNCSVLIESTSMVHPMLFYALKVFKEEFNLDQLFVTYTEPHKYKQNDEAVTVRRFDLTEKFCNRSSLPGFLRISRQDNDKTLVAIMGFEGNRFSKTYEEVNPSAYSTYAIVGLPSYQPNWQYYVYSQNKEVLEQSKAYLKLDRVTAYDPFGIYNSLQRIMDNIGSNELIVAPLGTKPHSIGSCMFAIDNPDVQLHYDYPFLGKKIRTEGVGKSYLYNLTGYIND
ncbi:hypothetical protein [Sanyastnella coralliicola]|uniref:hypothetical protein n=1 Tax=Sanyastnella coralliicola TaxID=3069118 RepID=UPI0027BAF902|nr:hypothetical protein [Longitalea sp. SCSIO 12813]